MVFFPAWTSSDNIDDGLPQDLLYSPEKGSFHRGDNFLLFQQSDKSGASFHAEMISEEEDGTTVWENGLYNPSKAKNVQYSV